MSPRLRRSFSAEFKADTVRLCTAGDRSIGQVAKDLDLVESAVRRWVETAPKARSTPGALTSNERDELMRLRRDNKRLVMEREILKKAAAFFAKESE